MPRKVHKTHSRGLDKLQNWLKTLTNASKDRIVIVEHKRDAERISFLGVKNVNWYRSREPEYKMVERLQKANKECILLFDTDRPSNSKCEKLKALLQQNGVKVNTRFRKVIFTSEFNELSGLISYLKKQINITPRKGLADAFLRQ